MAHMLTWYQGMFTELGIALSKYHPDRVMEHLRIFWGVSISSANGRKPYGPHSSILGDGGIPSFSSSSSPRRLLNFI